MTADEGDIGRGHLSGIREPESATRVVLTTAQMLTTGVDFPTFENVVLVRVVNAMTEFKQIIGPGTRMREDCGKTWFHSIDCTGSATARFADPTFDGFPELAEEIIIDEHGNETSLKDDSGEYEAKGEEKGVEKPESETPEIEGEPSDDGGGGGEEPPLCRRSTTWTAGK